MCCWCLLLLLQVSHGLLWVWPDASPSAAADAAASSPALDIFWQDITSSSLGVEWVLSPGGWFMRDIESGYDMLVENIADPAHVVFSHHGVFVSEPGGGGRRQV